MSLPPSARRLRSTLASDPAPSSRPGEDGLQAQGTTPEGQPWSLPWSDEDPLCFHTLSTLSAGRWGRAEFEALWARRESLAPSRRRKAPWGRGIDQGALRAEDARAGDDQLVFFSVAAPYEGQVVPDQPTVAYRLASLQRSGRVGWRPHDLLGAYRRLGSDAARRALAGDHTVWDAGVVAALLRIEARRLRRGAEGVDEACAALRALLGRDHEPGCARPRPCFCAAFHRRPSADGDPPDAWPQNLARAGQSELVLAGSVPLREAAWVWDGLGPWRRGDAP